MTFDVRKTSLASPVAQSLITCLNESLAAANPDPKAHSWTLNSTDIESGLGAFVVAYRDEIPIACGAVRKIILAADDGAVIRKCGLLVDDATTGEVIERVSSVAEVKRMFVTEEWRGSGVAVQLMETLEAIARTECGVSLLLLETGPYLTPARKFYEKIGFRPVPGYGEYKKKGEEFSVCYGKNV
ncbi:acyl-CoA N-acyltransferase [Chytriomyces sp. MP71]|nr:acyl-CoA N-acyltransferase [Chytriomyces sp. MP71]